MSTYFKSKVVFCFVLAFGAVGLWGQKESETVGSTDVRVLESLPQHYQIVLKQEESRQPIDANTSAARFILNVHKLWKPGSKIRVCFIGGNAQLHKRIAQIASEWEKYGNFDLDFGESENIAGECRTCSTFDTSDIKIGFGEKGHWSYVGTDSRDLTRPGQQSMNLGMYDIRPPAEPYYTATILHEFGHALGFEHEHQNPLANCDAEFDWAAIKKNLSGPPNYWSDDTIEFNLRQKRTTNGYILSQHDPMSIMHYSFEPWMFVRKNQSPCFINQPVGLSDGDKMGVAKAYPPNANRAIEDLRRAILDELARDDIETTTRLHLQDKLRALGE